MNGAISVALKHITCRSGEAYTTNHSLPIKGRSNLFASYQYNATHSSFPTAMPSAPQTCPGPSRLLRVSTTLASRAVEALKEELGAKAAALPAMTARRVAANFMLNLIWLVLKEK